MEREIRHYPRMEVKRRFLRKSGRFVMGGSQNWPIFILFTVYALNKNFPKF